MILADANIWIDFFRLRNPTLRRLLDNNQVLMHPYLVAELALASLHNRPATLARLDNMPMAKVVDLKDVRQMIETRALYSKGIGFTDTQLVASCLVTADSLGVRANLP